MIQEYIITRIVPTGELGVLGLLNWSSMDEEPAVLRTVPPCKSHTWPSWIELNYQGV